MQKVEDFRKEVELRRRLERNQERFVVNQIFADVCPSTGSPFLNSRLYVTEFKTEKIIETQ